MLPSSLRLPSSVVATVVKSGKTHRQEQITCKILLNHLPQSRFAIVVPAKITKLATQRNTIKRALRETIMNRQQDIRPGYDVVIFCYSLPPTDTTYTQILLLKVLKQAGVLS